MTVIGVTDELLGLRVEVKEQLILVIRRLGMELIEALLLVEPSNDPFENSCLIRLLIRHNWHT